MCLQFLVVDFVSSDFCRSSFIPDGAIEALRNPKIGLVNGSTVDCRMLLELDEQFRVLGKFAHIGVTGVAKACVATTKDSLL